MSPSGFDLLCSDLSTAFQQDPRGTGAAEILGRFAGQDEVWSPWTFFETEGYTRNLVYRCGQYELLLLCWNEGQASPIHDHDGQQCWMAVLDGEVEEVHYQQQAGGGLQEGAVRAYQPGQVAFIQDEIALHKVRAGRGGRGVSLHLYSSPIDSCHVFHPESGQASWIEVGYHSVRGELCAGKTAEAVREEFA
jgi:cysteine dioxygenase